MGTFHSFHTGRGVRHVIMNQRRKYHGEPTLGQVMRRPRWILGLLLALLVAAMFAGLAQWQMDHAVQTQVEENPATETPTPLVEYTTVLEPVTEQSAGHVVTFDGHIVHSDTLVIGNRAHRGDIGFWVVAHVVTELTDSAHESGHLAVALGWAATEDDARRVVEHLPESFPADSIFEFEGRYTPSEGPEQPRPDESLTDLRSLATSEVVNVWAPFEGAAFSGFVVSHETPGGLDAIESVPPLPQETINWLNLFYAVEWIVFGGFAIFFWYRLARDAWEKEHERLLLAEAGGEWPAA